jgi:hypothetical protein
MIISPITIFAVAGAEVAFNREDRGGADRESGMSACSLVAYQVSPTTTARSVPLQVGAVSL